MSPGTVLLALSLFFTAAISAQTNLIGQIEDPFQSTATVRVLIFARTDCPITNRYAPELKRIAAEFQRDSVQFWIVYPDKTETPEAINKHIHAYELPGIALQDPQQVLVKKAQATVSPQAAVFDKAGHLLYSGRIDDRYVDFGKSKPQPSVHDLERAIKNVIAGKPVQQARTKAIGCYLADLK